MLIVWERTIHSSPWKKTKAYQRDIPHAELHLIDTVTSRWRFERCGAHPIGVWGKSHPCCIDHRSYLSERIHCLELLNGERGTMGPYTDSDDPRCWASSPMDGPSRVVGPAVFAQLVTATHFLSLTPGCDLLEIFGGLALLIGHLSRHRKCPTDPFDAGRDVYPWLCHGAWADG